MTDDICDQVAERIVLGEPIGEAAHVATCARCRQTLAVAEAIRAQAAGRGAVDPGPGFAARMTVATQRRLVVRKRRRVAAGLAAMVATGALGVVVMARAGDPDGGDANDRVVTASVPAIATHDVPTRPDDPPATPPGHRGVDDDVAAVVELADTDAALAPAADWRGIEAPLAPYRKLIEGVKP